MFCWRAHHPGHGKRPDGQLATILGEGGVEAVATGMTGNLAASAELDVPVVAASETPFGAGQRHSVRMGNRRGQANHRKSRDEGSHGTDYVHRQPVRSIRQAEGKNQKTDQVGGVCHNKIGFSCAGRTSGLSALENKYGGELLRFNEHGELK
jgi:hypothetical protein